LGHWCKIVGGAGGWDGQNRGGGRLSCRKQKHNKKAVMVKEKESGYSVGAQWREFRKAEGKVIKGRRRGKHEKEIGPKLKIIKRKKKKKRVQGSVILWKGNGLILTLAGEGDRRRTR